jgi:ferric-dicitrate binding protein FerR (iron transport regulator)
MDLAPREPDEALRRILDAWRTGVAQPEFRHGLRISFVQGVAAGPEPVLAAALDSYLAPAREEFRRDLAARFVAGEPGVVSGPRVDLVAALDELRPTARPEFREALRGRFLSALDELEPVEQEPVERSPARVRRPRPARTDRRRFRLLVGGLATGLAAAAALVLLLLSDPLTKSPGGETSIGLTVDAEGFTPAGIRVDDVAVPPGTTAEGLARLLEGADWISTEAGVQPLRLVMGDQFVLEMIEGSRLDLRGLDDERAFVLESAFGGFRIATGPGFEGQVRNLEFRTPARDLDVVGTVFAVDILDAQTVCICCAEGEVSTWIPGAPEARDRVPHRGTLLVQVSGVTRDQDYESHQAPLRALRAKFWP